jgi:uncharacterized hydrophobic protein (TIGR00271 family)
MARIEKAPDAAPTSLLSRLAVRWQRDFREIDHTAIVDKVCRDGDLSGHFLFMTTISAGIAVLGLLLSSPAVVIGAMLISPLMDPIIAFGFGIALFDLKDIRHSIVTIMAGIAVAVLFSALIVSLSPLQTITTEIAARTRPNLFDLGVAILSGLAGTYATIRGRHGAIVGVAIAVAVMPPLAAVGFGLATGNPSVALGAGFLFFTNLMAISLSAAAMARFYGFGQMLSPRQSWLQATFIITIFAALAFPLGLALKQIAWETVASRQAQDVLTAAFQEDSRVSQVNIDFDTDPLRVTGTVFTPSYRPQAEARVSQELGRLLGRDVEVHLEQVRVSAADPASAQLAALRGAVGDRSADPLVQRVAAIAGADPNSVLLDRQRRVIRVRAAPLPGATLATYQALEARAAGIEQGWSIHLVPPRVPLPEIGDDPDAAASTIAQIAWAAQRTEAPVFVSGSGADGLIGTLRQAGADARPGESGSGPPRVSWFVSER